MAILNVKNVPDDLYEELRRQAAAERRSVSQQVLHLLSQALNRARPRSLLELRGLGAAAWREIDAAEHVAAERSSWDS